MKYVRWFGWDCSRALRDGCLRRIWTVWLNTGRMLRQWEYWRPRSCKGRSRILKWTGKRRRRGRKYLDEVSWRRWYTSSQRSLTSVSSCCCEYDVDHAYFLHATWGRTGRAHLSKVDLPRDPRGWSVRQPCLPRSKTDWASRHVDSIIEWYNLASLTGFSISVASFTMTLDIEMLILRIALEYQSQICIWKAEWR